MQRFVEAQDPIYERVLTELHRGRKTTHWMWFVFPQIEGLGHSAMAQRFSIHSLDEARAYLAHPVLGPRLLECVRLLSKVTDRSIDEILGSPDDMKFKSSMTLFARASADPEVFEQALENFFEGVPDLETLKRIAG